MNKVKPQPPFRATGYFPTIYGLKTKYGSRPRAVIDLLTSQINNIPEEIKLRGRITVYRRMIRLSDQNLGWMPYRFITFHTGGKMIIMNADQSLSDRIWRGWDYWPDGKTDNTQYQKDKLEEIKVYK